MNDAAITRPNTYAQIRIREPAGERTFGAELTIGGEGAQVVVPGAPAGEAVTVVRRDGVWTIEPAPGAAVRVNGRPLTEREALRRGDVLSVGEAQVVVNTLTRTLLRLDVVHLVGNATIPPVGAVVALPSDREDDDLEIRIAPIAPGAAAAPEAPEMPSVPLVARTGAVAYRRWIALGSAVLLVLAALLLMSSLEPVALDLDPADARVSTPGTLVSLRLGERVFVLPGEHELRAEREGYRPATTRVQVVPGGETTARLRLAKLPGILEVDTGGIEATASVDGVEIGRVPGEIEVAAGTHTITLSAPRHLDFATRIEIEGGGARQRLEAKLQPDWGTVRITAEPPNARVSIDGEERGTVPAVLEVESGVRRVELSAPGHKTWVSSIVVKAGETLEIGPVTLGQPDARVTVRSTPAGADVAVAGAYRGRTPLTLELPSGMSHDIVVTLAGHQSWHRTVRAEPGARTTLDARLEPVLAKVIIEGAPEDAQLFVDGAPRGRTPTTLELTTAEHRIEIRKEGYLPFETRVTPAEGLERRVSYKLTSSDRAQALLESAPVIHTKGGYALRLVPPGTFMMGSERREQGRRPNEVHRQVTLKRPFYIGVTEVTNAQFRAFRPGHMSGYVGKNTLDLDAQPVVRVSWDDAAAYCNWLSEQEGLPPAYELVNGRYVLKRPVTTGYRLPTEAEWEYAARYVAPGRLRRFSWGDELPVVAQAGNLGGAEAAMFLDAALDGYSDEYVVTAPVGKFPANPLGLHDMGGNVSEWVNDYYLSFVDDKPATDPLGPEEGTRHVVRGPNWRTANVADLRLAARDGADAADYTIGFRVARYAE